MALSQGNSIPALVAAKARSSRTLVLVLALAGTIAFPRVMLCTAAARDRAVESPAIAQGAGDADETEVAPAQIAQGEVEGLAGGKDYEFPATECFLYWANRFAPDDAQVATIGAMYLWRKKRYALAESWFVRALQTSPDSVDAQYNLGLLYFEMGRFDEANRHAQAAYALGYPLPGLRRKLEQSGHWAPGTAKDAAATQPSAAAAPKSPPPLEDAPK